MPKPPRRVNSKLKKTAALLNAGTLRPYVPHTRPMNKRTLNAMLERYGMVYVKPNIGSFGNGVIRVEKRTRDPKRYWFQSGSKAEAYPSFERMYAGLVRRKVKKQYLVQKGIHLLKHRGRRFDLRVMVQQNPRRRWETTGMIGRIAHPKKIVTNFHNGGTPTSVETLLRPLLPGAKREALVRKLNMLGLATARQMERSFPGVKEVGLDVGLDRTFRPWILEVNTRPDPYIFNQLKEKSMFRKIVRYAKAYGSIRR